LVAAVIKAFLAPSGGKMGKQRIVEAVKNGRILLSDGAWGTFLHQKGLASNECPESWNLTHREDVLDVARSYMAVGSDMIETNSFGGSGIKLAGYGLADRAVEINRAAAEISRTAAGPKPWVIASIGPTGKMLAMGDVTAEEFYDSFAEQAMALASGGADAICIETMIDVEEAVQAIRAAREHTPLEIICTFTFDRTVRGDYRTMMGVSPTDAARAAIEAGADVIGTNCGNGIERMIDIVAEIRRAAPGFPILVQANAGMPVLVNEKTTYPDSPEVMAGFVRSLVDAGANIVGGCCGTGPAHIGAMRVVIDAINKSR
jgi:5-methyltetrahydrofolate--homocysteine methyltransferase